VRRIEFTCPFIDDDYRIIRWVYVDDEKTDITIYLEDPSVNMGTYEGLTKVLSEINPTKEEINHLLSLDRWGGYPKHGKGSEDF
jgi:hypothetical protein